MFFWRLQQSGRCRFPKGNMHQFRPAASAPARWNAFPYTTDIVQRPNHFVTKSFSCQSEWTLGFPRRDKSYTKQPER
jgi:hypothetical protein